MEKTCRFQKRKPAAAVTGCWASQSLSNDGSMQRRLDTLNYLLCWFLFERFLSCNELNKSPMTDKRKDQIKYNSLL